MLIYLENRKPLLDNIYFIVNESKFPLLKKYVTLTLIIIFFISIVPLTRMFFTVGISNHVFWISSSTHSFLEAFYALISDIIGFILLWEFLSSGKLKSLFLTLAFFSMGVMDFFHAFSNYCHNMFVWFHSSGAFIGSLFLFLTAFTIGKDTIIYSPLKRKLYIFGGIALVIGFALVSIRFYYIIPDVLVTSFPHHIPVTIVKGHFSFVIYLINFFSGFFFLVSGILFMIGFLKSKDVIYQIFATATLLLSGSEISFVFSKLWDPIWWYWHFIKVLIATGLLFGFVYGFIQTFHFLNNSKTILSELLDQVKEKNIELMDAYKRLKETQKCLKESEKLASMGRMAATLAHEIKNPLGAIKNSLEIVKRFGSLNPEDAELVYIVENELERLNKLTEDFLTFARPFNLKKSKENIHIVIEDVLSLLHLDGRIDSGIEVVRCFTPDMPHILIDRDYIKQALLNIFINALDAMPNGGRLTITTAFKPLEDEIELIVEDSGMGMSRETAIRIFEPFFSTKDEGLGLGLNIVQKIIQEHGGYITISSELGKGTRIIINLPANLNFIENNSSSYSALQKKGINE